MLLDLDTPSSSMPPPGLGQILRLYLSVPINSREPIRTTVVPVGGGPDEKSPILVGAKEGIAYCVYAMHRRKGIYSEDADDSRPERWEGDALKNIGYASKVISSSIMMAVDLASDRSLRC
ncbi:Cytochrome P450 [Diaporthe eres]|nr:Cytochrome P450 [Diaporthe eres]